MKIRAEEKEITPSIAEVSDTDSESAGENYNLDEPRATISHARKKKELVAVRKIIISLFLFDKFLCKRVVTTNTIYATQMNVTI